MFFLTNIASRFLSRLQDGQSIRNVDLECQRQSAVITKTADGMDISGAAWLPFTNQLE